MSRVLRCLLPLLVLLSSPWPLPAAERPALERGAAILDPGALRALDGGGFGLGRMMAPARSAGLPLTNAELFALRSMAPVRKALDDDFAHYIADHKASLPEETIGVGASFDAQLFDRSLLYSTDTRFVLSGIVNRMDRAYVDAKDCGEIRLIYRLTRIGAPAVGELDVTARLPMTLNVVIKARGETADGRGGVPVTCAEIARRWLAAGELAARGAELAAKLTAPGGALDLVDPKNIERIETNIQIVHVPKSPAHDFQTDYLMKVFDYDAAADRFDQASLENQIDRDRLLADPALARDFKAWLLEPAHFSELDRGTLLIPERFLAKHAITATPVGFAPSALQPAFGLVAGEDHTDHPVFSEQDVVAALQRAAGQGIALQNIRSVAGFERRLNDVMCSGCHETRGIGGFHFPGVDWMAAKPSNSTIVPASPHFFGDQVRRRDILTAFRDGRPPDFSRGFAGRPQLRGSTELAGTEYDDGWGARCYRRHADAARDDKSFSSWTCARGLACQIMSPATRMGMCFVETTH